MHVVECDVPSSSALGPDLRTAYFHDSYRAPLTLAELGIVELFFALFGHTPLWIKLLLIARNTLARLFGLEVPTFGEIMKPGIRSTYAFGKIYLFFIVPFHRHGVRSLMSNAVVARRI